MALFHRVRQTASALVSKPDDACNHLVERYLTTVQALAFRELTAADQAHLCRVTDAIIAEGSCNADLIVAALLHDIGKVSTRRPVRLPDRIAKVLVSKFTPSLVPRLSTRPAPRLLEGFSLAIHHAELGAAKAEGLGCSPRTCWLIRHHEDKGTTSDNELCLLVAIDRKTV